MDPFLSQRRPRLHPEDVPEVIEGLLLRLQHHLRMREDIRGATVAFRLYYRLSTYRRGRPNYPSPLNWVIIKSYMNGAIPMVEDNRIRVPISSMKDTKLDNWAHPRAK